MSTGYIDLPASSSPRWKAPVANAAALPATNNTDGDTRVTLNDKSIYVWNAGTNTWLEAATPAATSAITALNTDVSANGPGAAPATIQPNVVTNAKLAQMPTNTIKGNNTGSTANALDLTVSQVNTMTGNSGDVTLGTANGLSLTGQALSLGLSSTSTTGALSSTDWNTFNSKQATGNYITALTGDGTASGPGSAALTLSTVNSNVGSFGGASNAIAFTVNAKGLVTAASATAIQIAESQVTNLVSDLALKAPIASPTFTGVVTTPALTLSGFTTGSALFIGASGAVSQDNSKFFWDDTNFRLGIGNSAPAAMLHIADTTTTTPRGALFDQYSTNTSGSRITARKARGTFASPTTIASGDTLGSWTTAGHDGTNFVDSAKFIATSTGTISTGVVPTTLALQTMNTSGVLTTGLQISEAQVVNLPQLTASLPVQTDASKNLVSAAIDLTSAQVTGALPIAKGGTAGTTAPTARANLKIDARTTFSNADYIVLTTDKYVAQIGTMSAPRVVTLPAANAVNAGFELIIADESGTVGTTNFLTLTAAGADTIDGLTTSKMLAPFGVRKLTSDGTSKWTITSSMITDVQTFVANGTWTKPAGAKFVRVVVIGGGGSGGSGRKGAAGSARNGGTGGGGGGYSSVILLASLCQPTETIVVGAATTGGNSVTASDTDGNPGTAGNLSSFGTAASVSYVAATGGQAGNPGTANTVNGVSGGAGTSPGGSSTNNTVGGAIGTPAADAVTGAGGSGGSITTGDIVRSGAAGGASGSVNLAGGSGGGVSSGGSGGLGTGFVDPLVGGSGGGGGGASKTTNAGAGANGGLYGAGGGGGGSAVNAVGNSGAGGGGSQGAIVVYSF